MDVKTIMKIGIYGCQLDIERILGYFSACKDIDVVVVFDEELDAAQACSSEYGIAHYASSINDNHKDVSLDMIYVNTSPESRCRCAEMVLKSGLNVLVDYPVSFNTEELENLFYLADKLNKHIYLLPELPIQRIRKYISKYIESSSFEKLKCVNLKIGLGEYVELMCSYRKPNQIHWFYQLPGNIFQYFLPGILQIINVYEEDVVDIDVIENSSNILPQVLTDEVVIKLSTIQTQITINISLKEYWVNSFIEYHYKDAITYVSLCDGMGFRINETKSYMFKNTIRTYRDRLVNSITCLFRKSKSIRALKKIVISEFFAEYYKSNSHTSDFYDKKGAISVIRLVNTICTKLVNTRLNLDSFISLSRSADALKGRVLITGGTGIFGIEVVEQLLKAGFLVRVLARKLSNTISLKNTNAEIFYGDLGDLESVKAAMVDVNYVVHAAADSIGDRQGGELSTILGTKNILISAREAGVKNLVYISSCSVYEVATQNSGSVLDENSLLERNPQMRGEYSNAKIVAERLVRDQMKIPGIQITCLRPGTYFGPGKYMFTPMVGLNIKDKIFLIIKNNKLIMPLVYYKNVASAVVTILDSQLSNNVIYNLTDEEYLNKQQYVEMFLKKIYPKSSFIYVPYIAFWVLSVILEILNKFVGIQPKITRYRLRSSQNAIVYSSNKIRKDLNWKPPYRLYDAFENVINSMPEKMSN